MNELLIEDVIPASRPNIPVTEKDAVLKIGSGAPSVRRPTLTYALPTTGKAGSDHGYNDVEYNFVDIGLAEDTDSYVYQANFKRLALAVKAGWLFVSRNQTALNYIKKRVAQIEVAQNATMWELFTEVLGNMFRYNNCFVIKQRDLDASGGKVRMVGDKELIPVAGYFVCSPDTIRIRVGKDNKVSGYKHVMPDGRFKIFSPDDVIHFHIYKKTHMLTATPSWQPVIEDVIALRRMEENIENLAHQFLYPLYQYKIGDMEHGVKRYEDGLTEIDVVTRKIRDMPTDGMLVIPGRHDIKGLSSEAKSLNAEPYLKHFTNRVISGSGLSQLDFGMGDTANRSTGDNMSKQGIDNVKFYQQCFAEIVNFRMIRELMLESTLEYDHTDELTLVELRFFEVDLEARIKQDNHFMLLYQGHAITESEMRKHIGKDPIADDERSDTYLDRVKKVESEYATDAAANKANAVATNKQQPTNQYKTNSGPTKKKSSVETDSYAKELYGELADIAENMSKNGSNFPYLRQLHASIKDRMVQSFEVSLHASILSGLSGYVLTPALRFRVEGLQRAMLSQFDNDVSALLSRTFSDISTALAIGKFDRVIVDSLTFRVGFIERTVLHRAYVLSKVAGMRSAGITKAKIVSDPDSEHYETMNGLVIELDSASPESLPPFRTNCKCDLVPEI